MPYMVFFAFFFHLRYIRAFIEIAFPVLKLVHSKSYKRKKLSLLRKAFQYNIVVTTF